MKFSKYPSLENHYREKYIDYLRSNGKENVPYILTEKIHGANFSFWCDGSEVRVASRNQFVDESFYNCGEVIEKYSPAVLALTREIQELETYGPAASYDGPSTLVVYGELFGPGVQKGVRYGAEKGFAAFDLKFGDKFVDHAAFVYFMEMINMPMVPSLGMVSSLSEVLEINNTFESVLGKELGIDDSDNLAEGFVAKPGIGSDMYIGNELVIIKSKTERFKEKQKASKPKVQPKDDPLVPLVEPYVNVNRLDAVVSKMGPLTPKDFGTVIKSMCEDVIEDMVSDGDVPGDWRGLDEYKTLGKSVNKVVMPFLKRELLPKL